MVHGDIWEPARSLEWRRGVGGAGTWPAPSAGNSLWIARSYFYPFSDSIGLRVTCEEAPCSLPLSGRRRFVGGCSKGWLNVQAGLSSNPLTQILFWAHGGRPVFRPQLEEPQLFPLGNRRMRKGRRTIQPHSPNSWYLRA